MAVQPIGFLGIIKVALAFEASPGTKMPSCSVALAPVVHQRSGRGVTGRFDSFNGEREQ
jgi:hypothetical protein